MSRHRIPTTDRLRSELSAHTRSLAELDGSDPVKDKSRMWISRALFWRVVHRLSTGFILHHALSSTSHNARLDRSLDSYGSTLHLSSIRKSCIQAFRRSFHVSLVSPSLTLEMDWIGCPYPRHWNHASVAIWIAGQVVVHSSFDCLCLATDFTSKVVFSHGHLLSD